MNRLKDFTDEEVYILQRVFTEASWNIVMTGKYDEEQKKLYDKLYNEVLEEDKKRLYKDEYESETVIESSEAPTYSICPHCNGHHTKLLCGSGTCTNKRNDFVFHYKCLDCGKEFDKEF